MLPGRILRRLVIILTGLLVISNNAATLSYPIVDTDQKECYNNQSKIAAPDSGQAFYGQDGQIEGNQPSYTDNNDGTITDNVTGLMWQKAYKVITNNEAVAMVDTVSTGGHNDWRLPSIKELYSLILFSGTDISSGDMTNIPEGAIPFIDTSFFDFAYGSNGERVIDVQLLSTTNYTSTTMGGNPTVFGVNIADGRIKGYPLADPRTQTGKSFTVRLVRGTTGYGINKFGDNGDSTVIDSATGLMWTKNDFGQEGETGPRSGMNWEGALAFAQQKNGENYLGHADWRLPNAKELQSILDYTRGPDETESAAIDPIFNATQITNEGGQKDYPWYWSSSTHMKSSGMADNADYFCFGRGMGYFMNNWTDVHGAGAQRSDQKEENFSKYAKIGDGYYFDKSPQGDAVRLLNYVRLVRDMDEEVTPVNDNGIIEGTLDKPMKIYHSQYSNGHVDISFGLSNQQQVQLNIYNAQGKLLTRSPRQLMMAGTHSTSLPLQNSLNNICFVVLQGEKSQTLKKVFLSRL
ncbi:MAG: DUF1566 domain-containing protein [Fibrobacteria bacterium]|nr:DUF1566 domain-containing protein [Fibrobacteria bacterium]